jgi:hypothetical protein
MLLGHLSDLSAVEQTANVALKLIGARTSQASGARQQCEAFV